MSVDLFIARAMITKASLVFRGSIDVTESQVSCCLNCLDNDYNLSLFAVHTSDYAYLIT